MNYQVITDMEKLKAFVDWLPDLQPGEAYYVALLARNKYIRDLGIGTFNSDRHQCKRVAVNKESLITKLKQMECPVGSYVLKGVTIPQEALACYISINPRDHYKATITSLKKFADLIGDGSHNHNVYQEAMSALHKSPGKKHFVDFDFDGVGIDDVRDQLKAAVNQDAVDVLVTRGGLHAIVNLAKVDKRYEKSWYKNISAIEGVDIVGDTLVPIPGTYQGGFTPYMTKL